MKIKLIILLFLFTIPFFSQKKMTNKDINDFYIKVQKLIENGKCRESLILLTEMLEVDDGFSDKSILYFANITECLGESNLGIIQMKEYIKTNKSKSVILQLALKLIRFNRHEESVKYYQMLIDIEPKNVENYIDLFELHMHLKNYKEAISILKKSEKTLPNNELIFNKYIQYYFRTNNYSKCVNKLNEAIKIGLKMNNYVKQRNYLDILINNKTEYANKEYLKFLKADKCNMFYYQKILDFQVENHNYNKVLKTCDDIISCDSLVSNNFNEIRCLSNYYLKNEREGEKYLERTLIYNLPTFNVFYIKSINLINDNKYDESLIYLNKLQQFPELDKQEKDLVKLCKLFIYVKQKKELELKQLLRTINFNDDFKSKISFDKKKTQKSDLFILFDKTSGLMVTKLNLTDKDFWYLKSLVIIQNSNGKEGNGTD